MEETLINGKPLSFYLRHPGALKTVDRNDLFGLAARFPFSAHLHLLITVKDHLENISADRELLEKAALYVPDRRKLGEWMNKLQSLRQEEGLIYGKEHLEVLSQSFEDLATSPQFDAAEDLTDVQDFKTIDFESAPEAETFDKADFPEEEVWIEKIEAEAGEESESEIQVTIQEDPKAEVSEGATIVENVADEETLTDEAQEFLRDTSDDVVTAPEPTVDVETVNTSDEEMHEIADEQLETASETPEVVASDDIEVLEPSSEQRADQAVEVEKEDQSSFETPFLKWLHRLESGNVSGYVDLEAKRSRKVVEVPDEKTRNLEAKKKAKKKKKKKKKKKSWKQDSLRIDETLVSEALADLLATQGHADRAIEMYEKLRLTIPEKSVFFAQKIKDLKQKK